MLDFTVPGNVARVEKSIDLAQALGDRQSLESKKRRVLRVRLTGKTQARLDRLAKALEAAVAKARTASAAQN